MGESFNVVRQLDPPFGFIDERVVYVPGARRLDVKNNDLKLVFFLDGMVDLAIDRQHLGRVEPGDVLVAPRRCLQTYTPASRHTEQRLHIVRLFFDLNSLGLDFTNAQGAALPPDPETNFKLYIRTYLRTIRLLKHAQSEAVRDLLRLVRREAVSAESGHRYRVSAYCRLLVTELVRQQGWQRERPAVPPKTGAPDAASRSISSDWVISHTKEFLNERFHRPLTLAQIAAEVRLSPEHLARRFKQEARQTVFEYLRSLRIESAASLLVSSKLRIGEISQRTGFASPEVFCRNFRRTTGRSPLAYRRHNASRIAFQPTTLSPDDEV